jgi:hypothetical protein
MPSPAPVIFHNEYILFCDESDKYGKFFSNFYGGVIVGSKDYMEVSSLLNAKKQELHLFSEVKWEKITELYKEKYIEFLRCFFGLVTAGKVKVRIMFRQNAYSAKSLSAGQNANQYYLLYYQFIKNAFGFEYLQPPPENPPVKVRVYVDQIGDTNERIMRFRGFIHALPKNKRFSAARFEIPFDEITEIRSHEHVLLQCIDIVLGSITFRLNDKHTEKLPGTRFRGKRTKAKEFVYKYILSEIRKIHKNFNIGISTAVMNTAEGRWNTPYSHWNFKAKNGEYDKELTKRGKIKNPI